MSDDCSADEICLNTIGTYECLSTPCPDPYNRDESSGQCVQICSNGTSCEDPATIARTISYTVLTLQYLQLRDDEPILKLVNYDINRIPLERTDFQYVDNSVAFKLESMPNKAAIAYLYVNRVALQMRHIYKLKIVGRSIDSGAEDAISYVTDFLIYVYVV